MSKLGIFGCRDICSANRLRIGIPEDPLHQRYERAGLIVQKPLLIGYESRRSTAQEGIAQAPRARLQRYGRSYVDQSGSTMRTKCYGIAWDMIILSIVYILTVSPAEPFGNRRRSVLTRSSNERTTREEREYRATEADESTNTKRPRLRIRHQVSGITHGDLSSASRLSTPRVTHIDSMPKIWASPCI